MSRDMKSVILRDKFKIETTLKREMTLVRWRDTLPESKIIDHNVPAFCYSLVDLSRTGYRGLKIFSFLEWAVRITILIFTHFEKDSTIFRMNMAVDFAWADFARFDASKQFFKIFWHKIDTAHHH